MTMTNAMIYIHIPFCDSKCFYCNFASGIYDDNTKKKYFDKLIDEIKFNATKDFNITSIYIGGGTPSSVDANYISRVIQNIKENYIVDKNAEISMEANPCSLSKEKLLKYKQIGINRLSIGVQSLDDNCLKLIGRRHTKKEAIEKIKLAKSCGVENINCDVLIGIPSQNYRILKNTVKNLVRLKVSHISAYMLINEPNTVLTKKIDNNEVKAVSEDKCVVFYDKIVKFLHRHGYKRYEVSNFAKDNKICEQNLGYWLGTDYFGFGLASHSYVNGERYFNTSNLKEYLNSDFNYNKHKLSNQEKIEERIMLGLRTKFGVSIETLQKLGYDITKSKKNELYMLKSNNFITINDNKIMVNKNKFGVLNQIILKLLP